MSRVYVIKCNDTGLCKIGRSFDVEERVKHISYSCGFQCDIAYFTDHLANASRVEAEAHRLCNGRKVGEWFSCATNEAISCVKESVDKFGILGASSKSVGIDCDLEFLIFWSVCQHFMDSNPIAVIGYALDKFDGEFSNDVLSVCNAAYEKGSGEEGDFVDRLDVQCFYDLITK